MKPTRFVRAATTYVVRSSLMTLLACSAQEPSFVSHRNQTVLSADGTPITVECVDCYAAAPIGEAPTGEVPTGEVPTGEVPSGETPTGEVASETPVEPTVVVGETTVEDVWVSEGATSFPTSSLVDVSPIPEDSSIASIDGTSNTTTTSSSSGETPVIDTTGSTADVSVSTSSEGTVIVDTSSDASSSSADSSSTSAASNSSSTSSSSEDPPGSASSDDTAIEDADASESNDDDDDSDSSSDEIAEDSDASDAIGMPSMSEIRECGRQFGRNVDRIVIAGRHRSVTLSASTVVAVKVVGNQNAVTINVDSSATAASGVCIFAAGNQPKVKVEVKSGCKLGKVYYKGRGNQSYAHVEVEAQGKLEAVEADLNGHKAAFAISGAGSYPKPVSSTLKGSAKVSCSQKKK